MRALLILVLFLSACSGDKELQADYTVIPLPQEVAYNEGAPFRVDGNTVIVYDSGNEKLRRTAFFLSAFLENATGIKISVTDIPVDRNFILLTAGSREGEPESYRLVVAATNISIMGVDEAGTFYGMQTLCKSIPVTDSQDKVTFPQVNITDAPRFHYRGMMLDVCRHFFSVDFVKKYIDLLALHHINYFHWHLTDDQGWRIEIKKYPELTEVGSHRRQTIVGMSDNQFDSIPHGGFYTQDEIRDVVAYAEERFITVIPEIDIPGHTLSVLATYPGLGCTGGPYEVSDRWGVFEDVLCAGNEDVYAFLQGVLDEVVELFPAPYIHIGGDECPKTRWQHCPKCQARIARLGLKSDAQSPAEEKLQSYFMTRIEKYLHGKGRRIIGWDEVLQGGVSPSATVMSWQGIAGGIAAARQHHEVIMAPNTHLYFDYFQTTETDSLPYAYPGYNPMERIYHFNPVPDELPDSLKGFIKGVQANLWTEFIAGSSQIERMVLPRMAALSEIQWTQAAGNDYPGFLKRLYRFAQLYQKLGYQYSTVPFDLQADYRPDTLSRQLQLRFSVFDTLPIYYTLDGTVPTEKSKIYTDAIIINSPVQVKARGIGHGRRTGIYTQPVDFNKATLKPVTFLSAPLPHFASDARGINLVDGRRGNKILYGGGRWTGFYGKMSVVIDLKEETEISEVIAGTLLVPYRGEIDYAVSYSLDGSSFSTLSAERQSLQQYSDVTATFGKTKVRYVRIDMARQSPGVIVCDEIVIR